MTQILINPLTQLFRLLLMIVLSLAIGLFPYVDNFAHIGGLIFGTVAFVHNFDYC